MPFTNLRSAPVVTDASKEKKVREIKDKIELLGSALDSMEKEKQKREREQEQFLGVAGDVESKTVELETLNTKLSTVNQELTAKEARLSKLEGLEEKISYAELTLKDLNKKINELKDLDTQIEIAHERFNTLESNYLERVVEIEKSIDGLENEKKIVEDRIRFANEDLKKTRSEMVSAIGKLDEMNKEIDKKTGQLGELANKMTVLEQKTAEKIAKTKSDLDTELSALKEKTIRECSAKSLELDKREIELNEKIKWQESDRKYLQEVKKDLETTYKIKIKRVI